jgi:hypothetical protein
MGAAAAFAGFPAETYRRYYISARASPAHIPVLFQSAICILPGLSRQMPVGCIADFSFRRIRRAEFVRKILVFLPLPFRDGPGGRDANFEKTLKVCFVAIRLFLCYTYRSCRHVFFDFVRIIVAEVFREWAVCLGFCNRFCGRPDCRRGILYSEVLVQVYLPRGYYR